MQADAVDTFIDLASISSEDDGGVDLGWGNEAITDDGKTKFWDKKESDRRRQGPQVGGSATGHIAKDGDVWGKRSSTTKMTTATGRATRERVR